MRNLLVSWWALGEGHLRIDGISSSATISRNFHILHCSHWIIGIDTEYSSKGILFGEYFRSCLGKSLNYRHLFVTRHFQSSSYYQSCNDCASYTVHVPLLSLQPNRRRRLSRIQVSFSLFRQPQESLIHAKGYPPFSNSIHIHCITL